MTPYYNPHPLGVSKNVSLGLILMHIHANLLANLASSLSSRAFAFKHEILRLANCHDIP